MGILEDVQETIEPLKELLSARYEIILHAPQKSVDIFISTRHESGGLVFLIHQENDDTVSVYFLLPSYNPGYTFIKDRDELMKNERIIVFSGQNLFPWLNISLPVQTRGYLENLDEVCHLIQNNSSILIDEFSWNNIQKTYNALIGMDGNHEEEMQKFVKPYYADGFAAQRKRE